MLFGVASTSLAGAGSQHSVRRDGQHKWPPNDSSRTIVIPPDNPRQGNIMVPTSTPSAAAATAAVCMIQLPQRKDAIPSCPVFVEINDRMSAGKLN